jgi:hypothetical protein
MLAKFFCGIDYAEDFGDALALIQATDLGPQGSQSVQAHQPRRSLGLFNAHVGADFAGEGAIVRFVRLTKY